ncbi:CaiB/BaiF CoA transferase family protein [Streptomyces sp. NPDC050145]|uniref:CaiB/BaiF CoA transferase family protein n=1 Tax=Streptomyces sp. NPDC050145 TaxID=3365602 RepID=UPI00379A3428
MKVLRDIQVVDLTTGIAGPIVGMFLADFGAEVVKVERPGGDPGRSLPGFAVWNRGKKSTVLDPAVTEERSFLETLLRGADIALVRDVGGLRAYGIDPDELRRANPRLVLVEVPPYTSDGRTPWYGGHESHGLLAASCGMARRQSSHDGGPVEMVLPQYLYVQGVWASVCTVAALLERDKSGYGQRVTVTGLNAVMEAAVSAYTLMAGTPDPNTAIGAGGRHPTYTRHQAGDGKWLGVGGLGAKFETSVLKAIGLGSMIDEARMGGISGLLDPNNIDWATQRVKEAFRARGRDEWLAILSELGVPCGAMDDPDQWLDHPQLHAIGMRVEVDDPERGPVTMPGIPLQLTRSPGRVAGPAPALGAHNVEVQAREPGPAPEGAPRLSAGPLAGYRILDQGTFVAGPYCGFLLAELGADVIKVEPKDGDPFRANGFTFNRGMRSLALDLTRPEGQKAFHRLVEVSDVLVNSLRPGVAEKLNIDHGSLSAANPGIITVSLSGYGEVGPMAGTPGVDMVIQAMSGMMIRQGGDDEPVSNTVAIIDTTTAALGALSAVLALFHREHTGEGQHTWFSLVGTATYLQSGEVVRYRGRPDPLTGGRDFRGRHPLDRFYQVADGWIRLQAPDPDAVSVERLSSAGISVDAALFSGDQAAALEAALLPQDGEAAARLLNAAGIPAVRARKITEVLADEQLLGAEFTHARPAEGGGFILTPGRYAAFSRTQRCGPLPVPGTGQHSDAVLRGAGLEEEEIQELVEAGIVTRGGPMEQKLAPIYR